MGDGAAEAKQSSGQRVEVDRVDIAGNRRVAATDISRDAPERIRFSPPTLTLPPLGEGLLDVEGRGGGCAVRSRRR